jgi:benzoyl-CoA reductase/2-hydroxyglutaryl-CoA dehydratase subunit BcrC/BadD/HgdB
MDVTQDRSNRLSVTRAGGRLITDYWDDLFTARGQGKQIVWYNGGALNPFFQAAGLAWCHGEAFAARLAAQRLEGPAQLAGAEYGYNAELCSYARTHLGCSVLTLQSTEGERSGVVGMNDQKELAARLPSPDFFVNNYAGCSTGQQWDGISFRVFGKQLPIFNISHPFLWGNKPDAGYLRGEEWESASRYVAGQLRELISFLEAQTGRPFDYDALSEAMTYIKRAAELRREGLDLCKARPAPATFWDWIACVAPINFLPGDQALVDYFAGVRDEIAERLEAGVSGVRDEKYRLYFDGIMNWNKLGFLSRKFAEHGAAVLCGRYIHNAFWQEPQLIDTADPILGMAKHYLLCPTNHGTKTLDYLTLRDCREYDVDGIVFHSTRTCRAFTGPQRLLAKSAQDKLGIPSIFFEGTSPMPPSTKRRSWRAGSSPCWKPSTSAAPGLWHQSHDRALPGSRPRLDHREGGGRRRRRHDPGGQHGADGGGQPAGHAASGGRRAGRGGGRGRGPGRHGGHGLRPPPGARRGPDLHRDHLPRPRHRRDVPRRPPRDRHRRAGQQGHHGRRGWPGRRFRHERPVRQRHRPVLRGPGPGARVRTGRAACAGPAR